jgi:hypothetical protein
VGVILLLYPLVIIHTKIYENGCVFSKNKPVKIP